MDRNLFDVLLKRDPVDEDVPYCTLKSFPAVIDHCIEWARDKVSMKHTQKYADIFSRSR